MCMEDIKLGREMSGSDVVYSVGAASQKILDADLSRVTLIIGPPIANTLTLRFGQDAVSGLGMNIAVGDPPIILNIKEHGELVTKSINAIGSGAGTNGAIWYSSLTRKE